MAFSSAVRQSQGLSSVRAISPCEALPFRRHAAPRSHLQPYKTRAHQEAHDRRQVDFQFSHPLARRQRSGGNLRQKGSMV